MGRLDGKVAVVTGAGRGQGRAHAIALAREGASVVACGIETDQPGVPLKTWSPGDLDETVRLVEQEDQRAIKVVADVSHLDQMQAVADQALEEFGRIDIMVANAGVVAYQPLHQMSELEWDVVMDVCLKGVFNSARVVVDTFMEQKSGRFIATSSAMGKRGCGNNSNYTAAKWGVIGFVKSIAIDLGPYGVTCNAICPGYVNTDLLNQPITPPMFFPDRTDATMDDVEEFIKINEHLLPVGRLDPSEISKAVVWLASDEAQFITGSTIDVGAGMAAFVTA
jgi:NAD(P)-dependent dehydrogenase (short-subunit alcohol dehydrogenase family)